MIMLIQLSVKHTMTFELIGGIVICLAGIVVMSISSVAIDDRLLNIKISGSISARICHSILGMLKGAFLIWLMDVTGLLGG